MTTIILSSLACLVAGFVFGVLFGRRNVAKVEASVAEAHKILADVHARLVSLESKPEVVVAPVVAAPAVVVK